MHNLGHPPEQSQQGPPIHLSNTTPIVCEECGHDIFLPAIKIRKVSKLLTGAAKDAILPIDVMVCGHCGAVCKELLPHELRTLEDGK